MSRRHVFGILDEQAPVLVRVNDPKQLEASPIMVTIEEGINGRMAGKLLKSLSDAFYAGWHLSRGELREEK